MNKDRMILRTPLPDRLCHWAMVVCFFLVAMSGLPTAQFPNIVPPEMKVSSREASTTNVT